MADKGTEDVKAVPEGAFQPSIPWKVTMGLP